MKIIKQLPLKLGLPVLLLVLASFIPRSDDPIDKLVSALQRWTETNPQEKVYIQTDKPYYAVGDTIWFKGYVTIGSRHQLSALSGALYVDLISEKDSLIKALKLPITTGMVMGEFTLSDDLAQGSYRIRAYTQWMRNAGEEYFFDRTFTVGNMVSNNIVSRAHYEYKTTDGKPVLTATLNYTDDTGKPIASKDIQYQICINKKVVWTKTVKTDAQGNIPVNISNEDKVDLSGAYIRTIIEDSKGKPITRDFSIKADLAQSDVQFFPEGGSLINGIASKVGFKAIGIDGAGINIKGNIIANDNNKEVAQLQTQHAGMGSFLLKPEAGKNYSANITFEDGSTKTIALPKALDEGYVLSIYQPGKDSVLVRIQASANAPKNVSLVAQNGGATVVATAINIEKAITSIWLDKKAFPTGIAQFTLFNNVGEPLNERIAFIRTNDQLQLNLTSAKTTYKSKERVAINLEAKDSKGKSAIGNFSVTVIDESKVPIDESQESTILSNILLSSNIKGYIEKPNYYFSKETDEVNKALDNLMLTQGYRRFSWKELGNKISKPAIPAEGLGIAIAGQVLTLTKKPVPNAVITLMALKAGVMKTAQTNANGRFKFDGIFLTDSIKFTVQARTAKNSDKVELVLDTLPGITINHNKNLADVSLNLSGALKTYIANGKRADEIYEKLGRLDQVQRLRQVNINARKKVEATYATQGSLRILEGHASKTVVLKNAEKAANLGVYLQGKLQGVIFKEYQPTLRDPMVLNYPQYLPMGAQPPNYEPVQVILDGRLLGLVDATGVFDNSLVDVADVVKVDYIYRNAAISQALGVKTEAALMIYTNRGLTRKDYNPGVANITPKGFNKAREFYSPRYNKPGSDKLPDLRTTIYWNPNLQTDINGRVNFNYFNADGPGTYKVIVEGINADGELGRQVYRYTVNEEQAEVSIAPPVQDAVAKTITTALDNYRKKLPVEKVYLHTDKPYYNIGDTLWFKSYLVDGANLTPSKLSGLLYVELDDDSSEVVRRISIPIKEGVGWGQIPLPKIIFHEGGYTLRAYTNWMQNFGDDYVFKQRFYLGLPAEDAWLVKSAATINRVADKDELNVDLKLSRTDRTAFGFKSVEVRLYEGKIYLFSEKMQTGIDGSLKFNTLLKDKRDARNLHVQIRSLEKADNDKRVQVPLNITRNQKIDVQFMPEGGNLVAGLKSTVGFKAIGEDGKGTPIIGEICDSKGIKVADFATTHNGMGAFDFTPQAGETYTASIKQPELSAKSYPLPKVSLAGTVMHINNAEQADNITVNITATANMLTTDSAYYLIGTSKGGVYYNQKVDVNNAALNIAKKIFPTGITRFTLFKGKRPVNERVTFIDQQDQLSIKITPNKAAYRNRDSANLAIEVKDKSGMPVKGSFSLAVTDDSQVRPDSTGNNSIAAGLLLNAELKGYVESPGYYVNRINKQAWQHLDNLMLTQGWTGYDWKEVFILSATPKFEVEKDLRIRGRVTNLLNKPMAGAEVIISSQKPSFLTTTLADADGRYEFKNLPKIDSGSFFIQSSNSKGKKMSFGNVSVERFKAPAVPGPLAHHILPWYVNSDSVQLNYVMRLAAKANEANLKLSGNVLKQVNINAKKIIKDSYNRNGPGKADMVFDEQDIKESATMNLYELIRQKLPGLKLYMENGLPTLKLNDRFVVILIDGGGLPVQLNTPPTTQDLMDELSEFKIAQFKGMEVNYSENNTIKYLQPRPDWIKKTFKANEVSGSENALRQGEGGYPWFYKPEFTVGYLENRANVFSNKTPSIAIIDITTKAGNGWFRNKAPNSVTYRPLPVMHPQQFYSPKYTVKPAPEPDYRSTVYWEPDIVTDQNGKANVSFYTTDIKSKYTIKIAGTDVDGGLGDGTFNIKIQ